MIQFFIRYPYFILSLGLLVLAATAFGLLADQRRAMMISGIMSAPWALASVVFVPEYWNPFRVASFLTGPEDIIFSFANGIIVWAIAVLPIRNRIVLNIKIRIMLTRACLISFLGFGITMSGWFLGLRIMPAVFISISLTTALLFFRLRRHFKILCVRGAIGFTLVYGVLLLMSARLFPHFLSQWNPSNLSGIFIWTVPIEEFIWAFGFGACWPLFMAYVLDAGRTDMRN